MNFLTVTVSPVAEFEIADAARAYEATRPGLGSRFLDDLRHVRARIEQFPDGCPEVHPCVRRSLMGSFPFGVLYRTLPQELQIIAVMPTKADPARISVRATALRV